LPVLGRWSRAAPTRRLAGGARSNREGGQLLFIAACFIVWWPARHLARERRWAPLVPAYAIGGLAAFWFLSRVTALV
jgi:hypothetical protein